MQGAVVLVSPTEPASIRQLGTVSPVPERFGADVLVLSPCLRAGVQRKRTDDLEASLRDGRLARELALMQRLDLRAVVVEGPDVLGGTRLRGILFSLQFVHGCAVIRTADEFESAEALADLARWLAKRRHGSLLTRPKRGATGPDLALHFLQGLPGVGPGLAQAILDTFGRVPMRWDCSSEDLARVPGIGPRRARQLIRFLEGPAP